MTPTETVTKQGAEASLPLHFWQYYYCYNKRTKLNKSTAGLQSVRKVTGDRLCVRGEWIPTDFSMKGFFLFSDSYFKTAMLWFRVNLHRVVLNWITPERLILVYCILYFKIRVTIVSATFSVIFCIIYIETAFTAKQTAQIQQAEENITGKN